MTEETQRPAPSPIAHLSTETHIGVGWSSGGPTLTPGLTVLWHPDPGRVGERAVLPELTSGRSVELSRLSPELIAPGGSIRRPLEDAHLSRRPVVLRPDGDAVEIDLTSTRTQVEIEGRVETGTRRIESGEMDRGVVLLLADRVALLLHRLDPLAEPDLERHGLVGESHGVLRLCREIRQVADLDVPVLVRGETGTGKELVAGAIHRAGPRREGPYLAVNLAGVPPSVAAAELFGAAKGAFTGADRARSGYFERAAGGSLFLDEIAEVPPDVQVLLLRALESGEIQPVGAGETRRTDARLIAATDGDLESAVTDGSFREPLLHRLAGFVLEIPPLRARREDLGRLMLHFLRLELEQVGEGHRLDAPRPGAHPWLPAPIVARLALHRWPGNVRQLHNVVRELVIGSRGSAQVQLRSGIERLLDEAVSDRARSARPSRSAASSGKNDSGTSDPAKRLETRANRRPDEITEVELRAALKASQWRPFAAARQLGISRGSIYDLMEKSPSIRNAGDLSKDEIEEALERADDSVDEAALALEVSSLGLRRRLKQLESGVD